MVLGRSTVVKVPRTTTEVGNGEICGYDPEHAWIFGGKRVYTGPYSDEFHPVLFKLVEKPALTPSATVTPTSVLTPTQANTPTLASEAITTATFSDKSYPRSRQQK